MFNLDQKIEKISGIKARNIKGLHHLGVFTLRDLVFHFPFRYEDYAQLTNVSDVQEKQNVTIKGEIISIDAKKTWQKRMHITEALVQDETGTIKSVWFNQYYLQRTLTPGKIVRLSGKIYSRKGELFLSNPNWELSGRTPTQTGRLIPVYPETEGVSSRWIRWQLQKIFDQGLEIEDPLPNNILEKYNLPEINQALNWIHFPESKEQTIRAQKRFAFEEMFLIQIKAQQVKSEWQQEKSFKIQFDEKLVKNFVSNLPFKLTNAQRKSAYEILKDLEKNHPMNRLLNGDVGSGKTIVAAIASLEVAQKKHQTAIMAPTEVLTRQHFESFCDVFKNQNINIALLTNAYKLSCNPKESEEFHNHTREELLIKIRTGKIDIIIGTHAIIQKGITFEKLALIIVDEQHRFGVNQRAYLQQKSSEINISKKAKNKTPHFLTMTATPIPRTLSMAFFGNLDISLLDEMPKNRKPIITKVIPPKERKQTQDFVRQEINEGRQAFIIFPLVEESKALADIKAAVTEHKKISEKIFPDMKVGLIHGRMKSSEKEKVMQDFKDRKYNILISTSVIEVGIDIPNASIMIIEDAERFGLSQLHQFRGRIGRGEHQSYCFLFGKESNPRLKVMENHSNGFDIAEKDLNLRGPGQFFGTRQSGIPDIAMENIANVKLIQFSKKEAQEITKKDPKLKQHPLIKERLAKFEEKIHFE